MDVSPPALGVPLQRGEPSTASAGNIAAPARAAGFFALAVILGQVVLIASVMRAAGLDPLALRRVVYIAAAGFIINHLLPVRLRLPFFSLLSVAAMVVVLGGTIDSRVPDLVRGLLRTATLISCGGLLIGICHLSIGFWKRAALLCGAGGVVALLRAEAWDTGMLAVVWPVLASMFMFRVMIYLYDRATWPKPVTPSQSTAYFFLFPNACTLLFPVIDFRTFCQKHYDENAFVIYQRGATWMARGVLHLLAYRVVDRLFAIEASAVVDGGGLIQFVLSNVFLYLKVSGTFHLIVGLLLLFGFNLPETNHRYFLASSFTDYWRRVNIYWRNFIMKVVYYPAFFRLKHLGQARALALATLWSFLVTWALHLYQTWWIKGSVTWSLTDALFWGALGVLVLLNSLWELKRNRRRKLAGAHYSTREVVGLVLRTAGTFAVICLLWSLWSTPTLPQWLHIWSLADGRTLAWGAAALGCVMLATLAFEVLPQSRSRATPLAPDSYIRTGRFGWDVVRCAAPLAIVFAISQPSLQTRLEPGGAGPFADLGAVARILGEKDADARGQARGYYESLTAVDQGGSQFFETMNPGRGLRYLQPVRQVTGQPFGELIPDTTFEHHGWRFTTNRWGMRDRDYELAKPPGTTRLAMLGSSHLMGYGVTDADMFEPAVEARLNAERAPAGRVEVLNFGIGGLSPFAQLWTLREHAARFAPDVVVLLSHTNDYEWTNRDISRTLRKRFPLPARFPHDALSKAGVDANTLEEFAVARLQRVEEALLSFCYRELVRSCRELGATPVYVFLPLPTDLPLDREKIAAQLRTAREAGFTIIDLSDVYASHDREALAQKDSGNHLNKTGHALVANALSARLQELSRLNSSGAQPLGVGDGSPQPDKPRP